jgi:dihydrofolate synthase / folylpolyglutamate synthase
MVYLPHWPVPHVKQDIMLGLERVQELLNRLGNPEKKLPPVIHISGTNGKGSSTAYLKAIFEDAGYKVHRYISPHLVRFNERIELASQEITDDFLHEVMEETRIACGDLHTTFFEATTAGAFLAFSKVPADVLILEVGMGGRMDATNVIDNPILSMITPITFDHVEYLGDTIAKIAFEKAGIIKPKVPCVVNWQMDEAMNVISEQCHKLGAPMYACGRDWNFEITGDGFDLVDKDAVEHYPRPSLFGIHQPLNAAAVCAAFKYVLGQHFKISKENIDNGLRKAFWPGRMQKITSGMLHKMLPEGFELWVDGGHNTGGAQMVSASIKALWSDKPTYLINGRTGDRDIKGFLEYFKDIAKFVCGVKVKSEPKGELAENIAKGAREIGMESYACDGLQEAIALIIRKAEKPSRILVIGSLYLSADVLLANKEG